MARTSPSHTRSAGTVDAASGPLARSPIGVVVPERVVAGWVVSGRTTGAALTLSDLSPLSKIVVRAPLGGETAAELQVGPGWARRQRWQVTEDDLGPVDVLVVGSGPGEWTVLAEPGLAGGLGARLAALAASTTELVSVLDLTHGRALVRLTGAAAADVLAKECAVDLSARSCPDARALRTAVARTATDIVRCDLDPGETEADSPSYLLHCERSSGQYLFDSLLDAGREHGIDVCGFEGLWRHDVPARGQQ